MAITHGHVVTVDPTESIGASILARILAGRGLIGPGDREAATEVIAAVFDSFSEAKAACPICKRPMGEHGTQG